MTLARSVDIDHRKGDPASSTLSPELVCSPAGSRIGWSLSVLASRSWVPWGFLSKACDRVDINSRRRCDLFER